MDPIADLLTKIRNALHARHRYVDISLSKMSLQITKILKDFGFVANFLSSAEKRKVRIFLKYNENRDGVIKGLKRISSPGWRKYTSSEKIPRVYNGMGITILSTSQGVMDGEAARQLRIGGEVLCAVW